jgi:hypothetical protein
MAVVEEEQSMIMWLLKDGEHIDNHDMALWVLHLSTTSLSDEPGSF